MGAKCCCTHEQAPVVECDSDAVPLNVHSAVGGPKLAITFRVDASESAKRVMYFTQSPLCMSFMNRMPIVINGVMEGGEGYNAGVRAGMIIEKIGDIDITEFTYQQAFDLYKEEVNKLEANNKTEAEFDTNTSDKTPTLAITFRADAEAQVFYFTQGPLCMSFCIHKMPIVINSVLEDGEAYKAGVRAGMVLEKIGEIDITEFTYQQALDLFKEELNKLGPKASAL